MALTAQDKAFLDKKKAEGLSFEEAWSKLSKVKTNLGLTGGSFTTRAASVAENSPMSTDTTSAKAGEVKAQGSDFAKPEPAVTLNEMKNSTVLGKVASAFNPVDQGIGGLKGLGSLALKMGSLGEKTLNTILPDSMNSPGGTLFSEGKGKTSGEQIGEMPAVADLLEAKNTGQSIGKFAGEYVAPIVATGGFGSTAGMALGAKTGLKYAPGLLGFLGSATGGTVGYSVADRGDLPTGKELAAGVLIDAATLGTLKFAPKIWGGTSGALKKIYNLFMDKGATPMTVDVLEQMGKLDDGAKIMNGLVGQEAAYLKDPIKSPSTLASAGDEMFKDFTEQLVPQKQAIGKELAAQVAGADELAQAGGGMTSQGVLDSLTAGLDDIGVKVQDGVLDFSSSKLRFNESNQSMLTKVFSDLSKSASGDSFMPTSEKWALAQALDDLSEYNSKLASQITGAGELPITKLRSGLMADVKNSLEESGQAVDLFDQYKLYSDAIESLNRRFGEGGEGGFSIVKALQGEQKFGKEARDALEVMKDITGKDYFEMVRRSLAAAEIAGNTQVKSLLATTSKTGLLEEVVQAGFMDKKALLDRLVKADPSLKGKFTDKILSAVIKALGLDAAGGTLD